LFILWGALTGRAPGSRWEGLALGAVFAAIGVLMLRSGGMTRGPRASQAASPSTVLDIVEGPFRREVRGPGLMDAALELRSNSYSNDTDDYILHVDERQFNVGRPQFDAAPQDGIVRAYLLPGSDRIVNLERIADAPAMPAEQQARARAQEMLGALPDECRSHPHRR